MRSLCSLALFLPFLLAAQPFAVGTRDDAFFDADRGRTVDCRVYHPAVAAGENVDLAEGQFPVLAVGHGFVMTVNAYEYLGVHYAEQGYIVVLPTTEGGFAPDHAAFGADLAFLGEAFIAAGADEASVYFGHVEPSIVLMGHSMGGGAAFLGAAAAPLIKALVTLAPAETSPSAVAAAGSVSVPALVFAASEDCVTPIADHQGPMYDALASSCKAFVNITGGGHCYFGDASLTCSFGELTCGPDLTISREEQHAVVTDLTDLWLRLHVREEDAAWAPLLDSLSATNRYVAATTCIATGVQDGVAEGDVLVTFANGVAWVEGAMAGGSLQLFGADGRAVLVERVTGVRQAIALHHLPSGVYLLLGSGAGGRWARRLHVH